MARTKGTAQQAYTSLQIHGGQLLRRPARSTTTSSAASANVSTKPPRKAKKSAEEETTPEEEPTVKKRRKTRWPEPEMATAPAPAAQDAEASPPDAGDDNVEDVDDDEEEPNEPAADIGGGDDDVPLAQPDKGTQDTVVTVHDGGTQHAGSQSTMVEQNDDGEDQWRPTTAQKTTPGNKAQITTVEAKPVRQVRQGTMPVGRPRKHVVRPDQRDKDLKVIAKKNREHRQEKRIMDWKHFGRAIAMEESILEEDVFKVLRTFRDIVFEELCSKGEVGIAPSLKLRLPFRTRETDEDERKAEPRRLESSVTKNGTLLISSVMKEQFRSRRQAAMDRRSGIIGQAAAASADAPRSLHDSARARRREELDQRRRKNPRLYMKEVDEKLMKAGLSTDEVELLVASTWDPSAVKKTARDCLERAERDDQRAERDDRRREGGA